VASDFSEREPCFAANSPRWNRETTADFAIPRNRGFLKDLAVLRRKRAHTRRASTAF